MGKKRGKSAKKARAALAVAEDHDLVKAPHSFVFHRGENCVTTDRWELSYTAMGLLKKGHSLVICTEKKLAVLILGRSSFSCS